MSLYFLQVFLVTLKDCEISFLLLLFTSSDLRGTTDRRLPGCTLLLLPLGAFLEERCESERRGGEAEGAACTLLNVLLLRLGR